MKRIVSITLALLLLVGTALAATVGEKNALQKALSYLTVSNFSYEKLYDQLSYVGFADSECKYACDNCGADWYDQAAEKAQSYMSISAFSKKKLIEQLEYVGFTASEAEYGAAVAYGENPGKPGNTSSSLLSDEPAKEVAMEESVEESVSPTVTKEITKSGTSFDLSGFSYDELVDLQKQVTLALWASDGWQEVNVPAGLYRVGVDIPAGSWNVSKGKSWARIKIGSKVNSTGNEVDDSTKDYYTVQINDKVPSQVINFAEGMYVEIYNSEVIFTPATGPSFSFK